MIGCYMHALCADLVLLLLLLLLQIMAFCENFKTLTQDMAFSPALAAGALIKSKNDLAAAANLITELS
jgi:hypothetical protein